MNTDARLDALQVFYGVARRAEAEHRAEVQAEREARDQGATDEEIEAVKTRARAET